MFTLYLNLPYDTTMLVHPSFQKSN